MQECRGPLGPKPPESLKKVFPGLPARSQKSVEKAPNDPKKSQKDLGSAERGHPDLFRFVPISPFSSDLFRFAFLVCGNTPICSDLLRSPRLF